MFKSSRWGILLFIAVIAFGRTGLANASPASPAIIGADPVQCFPGTGVAPTSPYPIRAYLPLVVSSRVAACASEVEPNDTHTAATTLAEECMSGQIDPASDLDWYRVNLCTAVPSLKAQLSGPPGADLDLYLYGDPPGLPLVSGETPGSNELLTTGGLVTGTYYLLVSPVNGVGQYRLNGEVVRPSGGDRSAP
jgi:hypothetical protein